MCGDDAYFREVITREYAIGEAGSRNPLAEAKSALGKDVFSDLVWGEGGASFEGTYRKREFSGRVTLVPQGNWHGTVAVEVSRPHPPVQGKINRRLVRRIQKSLDTHVLREVVL